MATKRDIDALAVSTKRDIDALAVSTKRDIDALAVATKRDIDALAVSTKRDIDALGSRFEARLERELRLMTWRFVTVLIAVLTVAVAAIRL